jgi:hypothetical protein
MTSHSYASYGIRKSEQPAGNKRISIFWFRLSYNAEILHCIAYGYKQLVIYEVHLLSESKRGRKAGAPGCQIQSTHTGGRLLNASCTIPSLSGLVHLNVPRTDRREIVVAAIATKRKDEGFPWLVLGVPFQVSKMGSAQLR